MSPAGGAQGPSGDGAPNLARSAARGVAAIALVAGAAAAPSAEDCAGPLEPEAVLQALNALRERGADCAEAGRFGPAPPLRWDTRMATAADAHAMELVRRDVLDHRDAAGRDGGHRLRAAGYAFQRWGENLAAGQETWPQVLAEWLASPAHCANLLRPTFTDAALACRGPAGVRRTWVLTLARPAARS